MESRIIPPPIPVTAEIIEVKKLDTNKMTTERIVNVDIIVI